MQKIPTFHDLQPDGPGGQTTEFFVQQLSSDAVAPARRGLHRHPYWELFWLRGGTGTHFNDFRAFPYGDGTLVFVAFGQVHTWEFTARTRINLAAFSPEFLRSGVGGTTAGIEVLPFFSHLTATPTFSVPTGEWDEIDTLFDAMSHEYEQRRPLHDTALRALLWLLLVRCARLYPRAADDTAPHGAAVLTHEFFRLLENSFLELRRVQDYAARLQVTAHRLIESVRERTGRTPGDLIEERLVLEAKRMLFHSPRTASEVAYGLGFKDPSHFGRFFKRHAGCSPGEARERFHQTTDRVFPD